MDELTVGMVVYEEFPNAWFTVQALRAMHGNRVKLLVLDAAPRGCSQTRAVTLAAGGAYHSRPDLCHTAAGRDHLVRLAETPWVLVMDPHVIVEPGGLDARHGAERAWPAPDWVSSRLVPPGLPEMKVRSPSFAFSLDHLR